LTKIKAYCERIKQWTGLGSEVGEDEAAFARGLAACRSQQRPHHDWCSPEDNVNIDAWSAYFQETAMAKAKKRVPARKKSSQRGEASAKIVRAARRARPKKAKSKVRRVSIRSRPATTEAVETGTPASPGGEADRDEGSGS